MLDLVGLGEKEDTAVIVQEGVRGFEEEQNISFEGLHMQNSYHRLRCKDICWDHLWDYCGAMVWLNGSVQKKGAIFNHTGWVEQKLEMEEYETLDILNWRTLCML